MSSNKSQIQPKFRQLQIQMAKAAGVKLQQLSKTQQTVIFIHLINQQFGLQCISKNDEVLPYPPNWAQQNQGVYRFNYRPKQKQGQKDNKSKLIQFRLVRNSQDNGSISVNYSVEDSEQLHQYQMILETDKIQESYKKYLKHLEQKLKIKSQTKQQEKTSQFRTLQPQWRNPVQNNNRQPFPLFVPNQGGGGFRAPFGGGQYIGPDHQIFRGRGQGNPYDPLNQNPYNINDPRRPPGSRFDPIDPFGSQGFDERPRGGRDFTGFDTFGRPIGGGSGGFNPGRFL